jgi:hypothetical protein
MSDAAVIQSGPVLSDPEVLAMLRALDRRVRSIEVILAQRQQPARRDPTGPRRGRGRPPGSPNKPRVKLTAPLFREHDLTGEQVMCLNVVAGLLLRSKGHRPDLLSLVIADDSQWQPPDGRLDGRTKPWLQLCELRQYAQVVGELAALTEVLRLAEHLPVDDVVLMKRGLVLVEESLQLPQQFMPSSAA